MQFLVRVPNRIEVGTDVALMQSWICVLNGPKRGKWLQNGPNNG
jgi:hypothetical protein